MYNFTQELDDLLDKALNLEDFIKTIRDAVCYNANEVQDGTHVLSALNYLLTEFEIMTNNIENINLKTLNLKLKNNQ